MQANGQHLLGLINDVLDLSKIEAGRLALALDDYALDEVVADGRRRRRAAGRREGAGDTVDVAPGLPAGHGEGARLTQVLLNLVGNAVKFTERRRRPRPGGGRGRPVRRGRF